MSEIHREKTATDEINILRPEELPFEVPEYLAQSINDYIESVGTQNFDLIDCICEQMRADARGVSEKNEEWIRWYYLKGGWREDPYPDFSIF